VSSTPTVSLEPATQSDSPLLSNLLELYIHDLSDVFPQVELGPDGRFGYPRLSRYWSDPDTHFAFLIRVDGRVGGFVLATRGSPLSNDPKVFDVAEFFVLRRYRRAGVGGRAARLLWARFPGTWIVRVLEGNTRALEFWRRTVAELVGDAVQESRLAAQPNAWRVFRFESKT
jgi:predicted acetyltransferase